MVNWSAFTFVRITFSFIAGILCYYFFGQAWGFMPLSLAFLFVLFLVSWFVSRRKPKVVNTFLCGLSGLLCFGLLGYGITYYHTQSNHSENLVNHPAKVDGYIAVVDDYLQEKETYFTTTLSISKVKSSGKWQPVSGLVLINFKKDSTGFRPRYGDVLLVHGSPRATQPPANPEQFDYRKYLARKNIYFQHFISAKQVVKLSEAPPNYLVAQSVELRRHLDKIFKQHLQNKREYGLASALILGVKDDLDNTIKNAYSNTGTMHVLAVSGLHVGLIFSVLMLFLGKFRKTARQRILVAILVLTLIWSYAFITALSASVLRAVVMFTFITIGTTFRRQSNIYNTLAAAAFFLLWFDPYFLFDVGFQLSFVAVIAIVYLQPKIYRLLTVNSWIGNWVWTLTSVSLAAQLGTFPLGLLYFHQFPAYFLVSNLIAVPLSTFIMYSGFGLLLFSWVPVLNKVIAWVVEFSIWLMNEAIILMEKWPYSVIDGIFIDQPQAILIYVGLLLLMLFMAFKKLRFMAVAVACFALVSGMHINRVVAQQDKSSFVVYNIRNQSVYGFLDKYQAAVLADSAFYKKEGNFNFNLKPHLVSAGIVNVKTGSLLSDQKNQIISAATPEGNMLYVWRNRKILVLQKPVKCCLKNPVPVDYIILKNNVWLKTDQLLQTYKFRKIILDSSNAPWYQQKIKKELDQQQVPYFVVNERGAFLDKPL